MPRILRRITGVPCCGRKVCDDLRINDDHFIQKSISDVSLWKKSSKKACLEISDVIDNIVRYKRADYLRVVVKHNWDLNQKLQIHESQTQRVKRTALQHAVASSWHEGVKILLHAGANCNIKCKWTRGRDLANHAFFIGPDQHFGSHDMKHPPMCVAIYKDDPEMVKLLLQNGADIQESSCNYVSVNLERLQGYKFRRCRNVDGCTEMERKQNAEILNELLTYFQQVGRHLEKQLQVALQDYIHERQFFQEHLDLLFTHSININPDYQGITKAHAYVKERSVNTTRWLIRHGAYCTSSFYYHVLACSSYTRSAWHIQCYKLPALEVLLQVGIKPSKNLKVHLGDLERIIQDYLDQGNCSDQGVDIMGMTWDIYQNILSEERQCNKHILGKGFSITRKRQMAHLRMFSDHSLDVYPEELDIRGTKQEHWQQTLTMVSNMLHFLNQPHTLQWHCRVCLRESLVSLSPSVIRTLLIPAALKRYILCHEI